jgi:hypothetical protein
MRSISKDAAASSSNPLLAVAGIDYHSAHVLDPAGHAIQLYYYMEQVVGRAAASREKADARARRRQPKAVEPKSDTYPRRVPGPGADYCGVMFLRISPFGSSAGYVEVKLVSNPEVRRGHRRPAGASPMDVREYYDGAHDSVTGVWMSAALAPTTVW